MGIKVYVDEDGVPYIDYGLYKGMDIGRQRSILAVAERGLWYWNEFNLSKCGEQVLLSYDWARWPINREQNPTNDEAARTMLIHCADWLMNNLADRGSYLLWCYGYPISYGVQAGWGSAHAQALGLQLLLRASELHGGSYLAPVEGLLRAFDVRIEDGGLLDNSDPQVPWFEKLAHPESQRPKVLNGMLFTLLGLHDIANRTGLEAARRQYEVGLRSVLRLMDRYDLGDWSAHDIQGKPASPHYHRIHVEQLDRLFRMEGDMRLAQWRDKFASYESPPRTEVDKLQKELNTTKAELAKEKRTVRAVKVSFAYRLGNMLVQAVRRPGRNTIFLPYRLIRLCLMEFKKRKTLAAKGDKYTEIRLASVKISPHTAMIKEKYIERFGVDKGRLGGYHETDWRRIEYISSLLPEAKSVLDVGIGSAAFLNLLISLNRFQRILGIDIKRHPRFTILFGSELYEIMYASVTNLPLADKCIDVVTCMEVLEHIDKQSFLAALHELRRVSHFLLVTVPYNEPEPLPSYHKQRFTDSDLLTYFPHGEFILLKKGTGNAWMAIVERL